MPMIFMEAPGTDAAFNLALEQYIFDFMDKTNDYLFLWQNHNAVVVGKNQNTVQEIDQNYIQKHHIQVVRRLSGGGAVYHDLGNLNFTFISNSNLSTGIDLKKFNHIIADTLNTLGFPVKISGRNDLLIYGKKFSGSAQYIKDGRIMHHGTLLFNSNLNILSKALNVSDTKIISKGIKSVKSRVTNLCDYTIKPMTFFEFKKLFINHIKKQLPMEYYAFSDADINTAKKIADNIYRTWDWNFGYSPEYSFKKKKRFEGCGEIEICLNINRCGRIENFHAYGDFFGLKDIYELGCRLNGLRLNYDDIRGAISSINIDDFFKGLTSEAFINMLLY